MDCGGCLYDNDKVEVRTIFIVPDVSSGRSSINLGMFQDWQVGTAGFKIASPRFKMLMFSSYGSLFRNFTWTDTHCRRERAKLLVEVPKIRGSKNTRWAKTAPSRSQDSHVTMKDPYICMWFDTRRMRCK